MKKLMLLIFLALSTTAFSQGLRFLYQNTDITGTTVTVSIASDSYYETRIILYNGSNTEKTFTGNRRLLTMPGVDDLIYCKFHYTCYPPFQNITTIPLYSTVMLKASETIPGSSHPGSEGLIPILQTGPVCKDHIVIYKFWEVDKGDTTQVTIHYTCATAIHEVDAGIVSDAYPNPAISQVTIDYALTTAPKNAAIVVYDVLGKVVKEIPLENREGQAIIHVNDLHSGLYFYTVIADGRSSTPGKLIIHDH
jgi:hypothetical protein